MTKEKAIELMEQNRNFAYLASESFTEKKDPESFYYWAGRLQSFEIALNLLKEIEPCTDYQATQNKDG